jgi:hypothetical protein
MVNQQVTGTCVFINYEDQTIPRLGCWAVLCSGRGGPAIVLACRVDSLLLYVTSAYR